MLSLIIFSIIPCGDCAPQRSYLNKKSPTRFRIRIGLGDGGVASHNFFSTPMLLNSSELMFETSKSAAARAANKSKQTAIAAINMATPFSVCLIKPLFVLKVISPNGTVMDLHFTHAKTLTGRCMSKLCSNIYTPSARRSFEINADKPPLPR